MKKLLFCLTAAATLLVSCNNEWDDYYGEEYPTTSGDDMEVLDMSISEFFKANARYSDFLDLLKQTGLEKELNKDQEITLWLPDNDAIENANPAILETDTLTMQYHISNVVILRNNISDGQRLLTQAGVYIDITVSPSGDIYANEAKVEKVYKLNNGVIYIIDQALVPKVSLFSYLMSLDDENYSVFKDLLFADNEYVFDKENSYPTGMVDENANTIYDSVFITTNPLFDVIDLQNEAALYTVLVPSNDVIEEALRIMQEEVEEVSGFYGFEWNEAKRQHGLQYIKLGTLFENIVDMSGEEGDVNSIFHENKTKEMAMTTAHPSLYVYNHNQRYVWRKSVQKVNEDYVSLSNGRVYFVDFMKVPRHFWIFRVKDYTYLYADQFYATPENLAERENWYMVDGGATTVTGTWTRSDSGAVPTASTGGNNKICVDKYGEDRYYTLYMNNNNIVGATWGFVPLEKETDRDGITTVRRGYLPLGEYEVYFSNSQNNAQTYDFYVYATPDWTGEHSLVTGQNLQTSTPWNFDRSNDCDDFWKDGSKAVIDGLGGQIGTVVIENNHPNGANVGTFSMTAIVSAATGTSALRSYAWAVKPTVNNY